MEITTPGNWDVVAFHYVEGGEMEKAVPYLLQAGDRARRLGANQEAIEHYSQTLDFLKEENRDEHAADVLMKLGEVYQNAFDFTAAQKAYDEAFELRPQAAPSRLQEAQPAKRPLRFDYKSPIYWDPGKAGDINSVFYITEMFSGLVGLNSDFSIAPDVAERWEILDGGKRWQFHLRKDVCWTDGVQVTAADSEY
ncbi:MAG: ABC transporter substrate-binding protein, partial [Chloroflexota bacterium]